jgi:hypothetical protein
MEITLEQFLVDYMMNRNGEAHLGVLGQAVVDELGMSMTGKLGAFITARPHLFVPDRHNKDGWYNLANYNF